jgi:hypothetical protein
MDSFDANEASEFSSESEHSDDEMLTCRLCTFSFRESQKNCSVTKKLCSSCHQKQKEKALEIALEAVSNISDINNNGKYMYLLIYLIT